jgi:hypothetical protein
MNERIKELSLQASDSIPDDVSAEHAMYLFQKKFAELIVRECIKLAVPEDSYRDEWFKAKCDVMNRIKEHFGVEE